MAYYPPVSRPVSQQPRVRATSRQPLRSVIRLPTRDEARCTLCPSTSSTNIHTAYLHHCFMAVLFSCVAQYTCMTLVSLHYHIALFKPYLACLLKIVSSSFVTSSLHFIASLVGIVPLIITHLLPEQCGFDHATTRARFIDFDRHFLLILHYTSRKKQQKAQERQNGKGERL